MRGHVRVRAAFLGPAPLVVPALRHGLRAGVGDEVVIDVVHPRGHRVGGEHRRREQGLDLQRIARVGDPRQLRAQRPQSGQRGQAGQRPGLGGGQVLELLGRRGAEREAHAHRRQQRHVLRSRGGVREHHPGGRPREERVQQHRPRIPGPDAHPPRITGRRLRFLRRALRLRRYRSLHGLRGLLLLGGRFRSRRERQRLGRVRRAQAAQHRGLVHPQPPRDLRVPQPARQARARSHDASAVSRGRPAGGPGPPCLPSGTAGAASPRNSASPSSPRRPPCRRTLAAAAPPPPSSASRCRPRETGTAAPTRQRLSSGRRCRAGAGHAHQACHPRWQQRQRTCTNPIII